MIVKSLTSHLHVISLIRVYACRYPNIQVLVIYSIFLWVDMPLRVDMEGRVRSFWSPL